MSPNADVRDRWLAAANTASEVRSFAEREERKLHPDIVRLMDEYINATLIDPARSGRLDAIAVDDDGKPVRGVTIKYIAIGFSLLPWVPPPTKETSFEANGEFTLPWPATQSVIHLDLFGPAYRTLQIDLAPHFDDEDARYRDAEWMLEAGLILPPLTKDGPVRIVVPPALVWNPFSQQELDTAPMGIPLSIAPATAPADSRVIAASGAEPAFVRVPVRGTYALVGARSRIFDLAQLDRRMRVGLQVAANHTFVRINYAGDDSGQDIKDGPFKWVLFSTPRMKQGP